MGASSCLAHGDGEVHRRAAARALRARARCVRNQQSRGRAAGARRRDAAGARHCAPSVRSRGGGVCRSRGGRAAAGARLRERGCTRAFEGSCAARSKGRREAPAAVESRDVCGACRTGRRDSRAHRGARRGSGSADGAAYARRRLRGRRPARACDRRPASARVAQPAHSGGRDRAGRQPQIRRTSDGRRGGARAHRARQSQVSAAIVVARRSTYSGAELPGSHPRLRAGAAARARSHRGPAPARRSGDPPRGFWRRGNPLRSHPRARCHGRSSHDEAGRRPHAHGTSG